MQTYITGTVDQELLLRNDQLAAENRNLKALIKPRLRFTDAGRSVRCRDQLGADYSSTIIARPHKYFDPASTWKDSATGLLHSAAARKIVQKANVTESLLRKPYHQVLR